MKIKKGDKIIILSGRDRGKTGVVEKVIVKEDKVLIPGVNLVKKHRKAQGSRPGGIQTLALPLSVSKVMLVCPKCSQKTKVGKKEEPDGKRYRVCKECAALI